MGWIGKLSTRLSAARTRVQIPQFKRPVTTAHRQTLNRSSAGYV
jgi:hypothetical protein